MCQVNGDNQGNAETAGTNFYSQQGQKSQCPQNWRVRYKP